jgi:hypothetical protein
MHSVLRSLVQFDIRVETVVLHSVVELVYVVENLLL